MSLVPVDIHLLPGKMLALLTGATGWQLLIELAMLVDAGKPFYEETFFLEGDGFLAPFCL